MRAVISVINAAGILKRKAGDIPEGELILRALKDVNVPKFLSFDIPLFENIISDLFPEIQKPKYQYGQLKQSVVQVIKESNLIDSEYFL